MRNPSLTLLKILRPFSKVLHALKVWFRNRKLYLKLQILILSFVLVSYFTALALYEYSVNLYNQQLYKDAASILSLSTQNIENEMNHLLSLTSQLSTDELLQETIRKIENASSEYEEYTNRQKLMSKIYTSLNTRKYILSVTYIDPNLRIDTAGSDTSILLDGQAQKLYDIAFSQNGRPSWVTDADTLLVCPIREVENLSLRHMGAIVIRIRLEKLVESTMNFSRGSSDSFFIYDTEQQLAYANSETVPFQPEQISDEEPYTICTENDASYFVVQKNSGYSSWNYYYAIPLGNILARFERVKWTVFLIFSGLYLLLTVVTVLFSKSITRPLIRLARQMEHVQNIDFEVSHLSFGQQNRRDEIGQLQQTFQNMLKKIEELIQQNYLRQLVLKDTQYRMLQTQINPHFIYNTLDSIYWMAIKEHQTDISTMVFSLGKLLRESLRKENATDRLSPLRAELQILNYYISIQKIRFREKLDVQMQVENSVLDCKIPRMLLQPLVENAILYGAETMVESCTILILAKLENRHLLLQVKDNGIGVEPHLLEKLKSGECTPKGHGIGLSNIVERLELIYGEDCLFTIENRKTKGTVVTLKLPVSGNPELS
ncbi:MAG: sensor histidine kinase [Eubacteriales bacterium]|nr:sensor histidine kinase [Eubacteriales bacterium]